MLDFSPMLAISSLITGELSHLRHISALDPIFMDLTADTEIGRGALGTDSLDLLTLAGAVAEMFHLHETGVEEYLLRYRTLADWAKVVSVSMRAKSERITFRTSGSTGEPKRCVHAFPELVDEAMEHARSLSGCSRVLSMVPGHHIYGFIWTILVPTHLGIQAVDVRRWSPSKIATEISSGDLVVGVPSSWQLLSRDFDLISAPYFGATAGAACPSDLFHQIRSTGCQLFETYGASETGGIGTRTEAYHPFRLLPFWRREVSADDAAESFLVRNSTSDDPDRVSPPDRLLWENDTEFYIGARQDGAVQISGNNVFPSYVASLIGSHPCVESCAVRLMRPEEGKRLKAFVVPRQPNSGEVLSQAELQQWLTSKLQTYELPGSFTFGDTLPVNEMNKAADWKIPC